MSGQVAVVTGAAKGIGRAIAVRLGEDGAQVAAFDIDTDALAETAAALRAAGVAIDGHAVDLTDEEAVDSAVAAVQRRHGRIDVLVNNAGIYPYIPFDALTLDSWRKIMGTNTESAFLCCKAVVPIMRERGYGRIVNFASCVFLNGVGGPAYVASKAAAIGFTRGLAREISGDGITVNAVAPGLIDTEGMRSLGDRADELFEFVVPAQLVNRKGQPEDIAEAVAYLAGPGAGFITGQMINVDGGDRFH